MTDHVQYALNSGAWFLGGCIVSSIFWRIYLRRRAVQDGAAKEPALSVFTAVLVGMVTCASVLLAESSRIQQADYEQCQVKVNEQFRAGYAERVRIAAQDRKAIDDTFRAVLTSTLDRDDVRRILGAYLDARMAADAARARNPVVVSGNCRAPGSAADQP